MSEKPWDVLREYQKQIDEEGVEVGVSRQALYETLEHMATLERRIKELEESQKSQKILTKFYKDWLKDENFPVDRNKVVSTEGEGDE